MGVTSTTRRIHSGPQRLRKTVQRAYRGNRRPARLRPAPSRLGSVAFSLPNEQATSGPVGPTAGGITRSSSPFALAKISSCSNVIVTPNPDLNPAAPMPELAPQAQDGSEKPCKLQSDVSSECRAIAIESVKEEPSHRERRKTYGQLAVEVKCCSVITLHSTSSLPTFNLLSAPIQPEECPNIATQLSEKSRTPSTLEMDIAVCKRMLNCDTIKNIDSMDSLNSQSTKTLHALQDTIQSSQHRPHTPLSYWPTRDPQPRICLSSKCLSRAILTASTSTSTHTRTFNKDPLLPNCHGNKGGVYTRKYPPPETVLTAKIREAGSTAQEATKCIPAKGLQECTETITGPAAINCKDAIQLTIAHNLKKPMESRGSKGVARSDKPNASSEAQGSNECGAPPTLTVNELLKETTNAMATSKSPKPAAGQSTTIEAGSTQIAAVRKSKISNGQDEAHAWPLEDASNIRGKGDKQFYLIEKDKVLRPLPRVSSGTELRLNRDIGPSKVQAKKFELQNSENVSHALYQEQKRRSQKLLKRDTKALQTLQNQSEPKVQSCAEKRRVWIGENGTLNKDLLAKWHSHMSVH